MAESDAAVLGEPLPLAVRAARSHVIADAAQLVPIYRKGGVVVREDSGDSTHGGQGLEQAVKGWPRLSDRDGNSQN